jgi:site-specific DNA-adenine methylase
MKQELLYKIADIINSNSTKYRAVIPRVKRQYVTQQGNRLVKSTCYVLNVMLVNRPKNYVTRNKWNIYENDIDKIIKKMARRNKEFAQRIDNCEPTLFDIEMIIRRASFQALKLKLVVTSYDIYLENK